MVNNSESKVTSEELISASRAAEFLHVPLYDVMQNMRVE